MNTLTIAVLVMCATIAYVGAVPVGDDVVVAPVEAVEAVAEDSGAELLQGEESRHWGYRGHHGHYGHHHGHYGHHHGHYGHHHGGWYGHGHYGK